MPKRITQLVTLLLFTHLFLFAQETVPAKVDWEDPSVFERGQSDPHAFHIPYESVEDMHAPAGSNSNYMLLNGQWKFLWLERPELVPENFQDPGYNTRKWDEITVPSNWQMEGYGHAKFRNIALTFESDPPNIPDYYNPTGCYKRTFKVPSEWMAKVVTLRFEGLKSASYIWINGQEVGYNQGGFEPAEFNISPFLKKGKNDISVKVIRFSDGSYLENQDMWRLSGIFRDVKLYAQPKVHIQDFYHTTDLDENYDNATFNTQLKVMNNSAAAVNDYTVELEILDNSHSSILHSSITKSFGISAGESKTIELATTVKSPKKWSAEYPDLYSAVYTLKNQDGECIEVFSSKVGFREVEMRDELFMVNGVPVKLNGVNSHMHHPEHGQAVPLETLRKDLLLMKQHNINCVRTCHYPPTHEYLDMADELGIYIIDEVGDEAHFNIQLSYDSTFTEMYRDRSRKLVYRDRNHPSVIMWSAGNESGSGPNIDEVIKTGKAIDPSRPGWMYGGNTFYIPYEDITGPRYWIPYQLKNLAERKILGEDDLRPAFMDEYLAATGNGLGGLDEYWEIIRRYPRISGGAIWDWISPGINTQLRVISDRSSKHNDAAILGQPDFVQGKNGLGLEFSGHDDWLELYRDQSLDITGNEITISFWIKAKEIPQPNTILTKGKHQYGVIMNTPNSLEFYVQSNNINDILQTPYFNNETKRISAIAEVPDNWYDEWHKVNAIYDGAALKLFIDDKLLASTNYSGTIAHSPFPLCIGRDAESQDQGEYSGRMSSMTIDDLKIYNTALDPAEADKNNSSDALVLFLDFENSELKGNYFSTGLGGRTYGIIWPDRTIQPEIHQIKKSGQPIEIKARDIEKGIFTLINHHHFRDLSTYTLEWELLVDGKKEDSGSLDLELAAQAKKDISIPFDHIISNGEQILTLSFKSKEGTNWADAGFEAAWEQFLIAPARPQTKDIQSGTIEIRESETSIYLKGKSFEYAFNKKNGEFEELNHSGREHLESGPLFNIWRAPLANDMDPWGSYTYDTDKMMDGHGRSIDNQLRTLGMRTLDVQVDASIAELMGQDNVQIKVLKFCNSTAMRGSFECNETYTIAPDGAIDIELSVTPHGNMPDMLPKLGWQFKLPKALRNIEWYGRGPFETYPDRKTGAKIGIYKSDIDAEYVPYIIPQDYGNHTDTRWLKVSNDDGHGLLIKSHEGINFSFHKFSTENLSRAMYTHQLKEADSNYLNLDFEVSGVGGTAIRQLQKYRVNPRQGNYKMRIEFY